MWDVTITQSWNSASPLATFMGSPHSWHPNECPLVTLIGLYTLSHPRLSNSSDTIYNDPPQMTQYCLLFALPNQTYQEVTHPGTTLTEARLIAEL